MQRVCFQLQVRPELIDAYFETPSLSVALQQMAETEVNRRWQAEMAGFFEDLGEARPDEGFLVLQEIFHLEDQLDEQLGRNDREAM